MTRNKKMVAGIMAGCLMFGVLMTGCTGNKSDSEKSVKLEQGTIEEDSIVIGIGSTGVKYSEVRNYCYLMKQQYEGSFGNQLWNYQLEDGITIGDEVKEEIINMITQLKVICATAKEQEVSLTSDEKDEALQKAEQIMASANDEDKEKYLLSLQGMSKIYEENALANKMFYIATDDADTEVTDEEAKQIRIQYIQIMTKGTNQNGTEINLNETEKAEALARAQELQKEAKEADNFVELAKKNSDSAVIEQVIGRDNTELDAEAVTAAFSLTKGNVSEVVSTESGYYIIYCVNDNDADATYVRREEIIEERQTKMFKEKYAKWLGNYDVNISKSFWKIFEI